jgi:hypothetical protein
MVIQQIQVNFPAMLEIRTGGVTLNHINKNVINSIPTNLQYHTNAENRRVMNYPRGGVGGVEKHKVIATR